MAQLGARSEQPEVFELKNPGGRCDNRLRGDLPVLVSRFDVLSRFLSLERDTVGSCMCRIIYITSLDSLYRAGRVASGIVARFSQAYLPFTSP